MKHYAASLICFLFFFSNIAYAEDKFELAPIPIIYSPEQQTVTPVPEQSVPQNNTQEINNDENDRSQTDLNTEQQPDVPMASTSNPAYEQKQTNYIEIPFYGYTDLHQKKVHHKAHKVHKEIRKQKVKRKVSKHKQGKAPPVPLRRN